MSWNSERTIELGKRLSNWGRWGNEDEVGTVNYVTSERVVRAAKLVSKGKCFSLSIPFDASGPQLRGGGLGRFNPIHVMLRTGSDIISGRISNRPVRELADDMVIMPLQCATQWDGLSHGYDLDAKMYNNRDASLVTSLGAQKNGIQNYRDKIAGRGVLLDIAKYMGIDWLEPGYGITPEDLSGCASRERVTLETGDFVLIRTGQIAQIKRRGDWGDYAGGDAPGLTLETLEWIHENRIASVAADTWGVEVRPNQTPDVSQPWHKIAIPRMGLLVGEIFDLDELAEDCSADSIYEFFFVAPVIPFTGAVGSPVNPIALK